MLGPWLDAQRDGDLGRPARHEHGQIGDETGPVLLRIIRMLRIAGLRRSDRIRVILHALVGVVRKAEAVRNQSQMEEGIDRSKAQNQQPESDLRAATHEGRNIARIHPVGSTICACESGLRRHFSGLDREGATEVTTRDRWRKNRSLPTWWRDAYWTRTRRTE